MAPRLCVNVDHVATLRQARGTDYPSPLEAARIAEGAGAAGITIHLRSDRRHIQDDDLARLRPAVRGKLNLEMAATREMTDIALVHRPDQVTLVPERPEELTTEGGLDLLVHGDRVREVAEELLAGGISVSIFVDPEIDQLRAIPALEIPAQGFEINTDAYTRASGSEVAFELEKIVHSARWGGDSDLEVYAGHGLNLLNVGPVAGIPQIEELNIGHALVGDAVLVGLEAAVHRMLAAMGVAADSADPPA